jgi:hypothetical protein
VCPGTLTPNIFEVVEVNPPGTTRPFRGPFGVFLPLLTNVVEQAFSQVGKNSSGIHRAALTSSLWNKQRDGIFPKAAKFECFVARKGQRALWRTLRRK